MPDQKSVWNTTEYEKNFSFVYEYGEDLLKLLNPKPGERILDLGCGTGQLTNYIGNSGAEVVGMDKSEGMISSAKAKYPALEFHQKDATNFRFEHRFNAIFSNATLHWVLDPLSCIRSMNENLKSGGRLVLEFGGKDNVRNIIVPLRKVLAKNGYTEQSKLILWYFPSIGSYASALEDAGFHVISAWHYNRPTTLQTDLCGWMEMFADPFFKGIPSNEIELIKKEAQELAKPKTYINGNWVADYWRIRIQAKKIK